MKLLFKGNPVAELSDVFEDQATWHADYSLCEPLPIDLERFIDFSRHSLSEGTFDECVLQEFAHYINSVEWAIQRSEGVVPLLAAPLFGQSDLSWIE